MSPSHLVTRSRIPPLVTFRQPLTSSCLSVLPVFLAMMARLLSVIPVQPASCTAATASPLARAPSSLAPLASLARMALTALSPSLSPARPMVVQRLCCQERRFSRRHVPETRASWRLDRWDRIRVRSESGSCSSCNSCGGGRQLETAEEAVVEDREEEPS